MGRFGTVLCLLALLASCGREPASEENRGSKPDASETSSRPSGKGVCALLLQSEVDDLFGTSVGAGVDESLDEGIGLCSWPAGEMPSLLLQVGPAGDDIRQAVDLGEGYRISEISGMSGAAALAVSEPETTEGSAEDVAVLALAAGDKVVIMSPIGLGISEGTPRFERLKSLLETVATRL